MPWQVQEEILRAKSYLTIHKMTRKSLDIESAIEALELAYNRLDDNDFENFDAEGNDSHKRKKGPDCFK